MYFVRQTVQWFSKKDFLGLNLIWQSNLEVDYNSALYVYVNVTDSLFYFLGNMSYASYHVTMKKLCHIIKSTAAHFISVSTSEKVQGMSKKGSQVYTAVLHMSN